MIQTQPSCNRISETWPFKSYKIIVSFHSERPMIVLTIDLIHDMNGESTPQLDRMIHRIPLSVISPQGSLWHMGHQPLSTLL